jgi:hypothetical protein
VLTQREVKVLGSYISCGGHLLGIPVLDEDVAEVVEVLGLPPATVTQPNRDVVIRKALLDWVNRQPTMSEFGSTERHIEATDGVAF